jgi:hypothetical protein
MRVFLIPLFSENSRCALALSGANRGIGDSDVKLPGKGSKGDHLASEVDESFAPIIPYDAQSNTHQLVGVSFQAQSVVDEAPQVAQIVKYRLSEAPVSTGVAPATSRHKEILEASSILDSAWPR